MILSEYERILWSLHLVPLRIFCEESAIEEKKEGEPEIEDWIRSLSRDSFRNLRRRRDDR